MQDESRSMGDAVIDMGSQGNNPLQLQLIDEQVYIYINGPYSIFPVAQMHCTICLKYNNALL